MTLPAIHRILTTIVLYLAAMGLGLMFSLRGVSPELGVSGFTLAFLTFFPTIYALFSEGANMPECRRRAIEAALPAFKLNTCRHYILRPVSCLAYIADIPLSIVATPIGWLVDAIYEPFHN